ncbi:MAG TPA: peptidoglycan-associated lipoprotein Pal [Gemmatimonadaceae bacterium]|nr:peptidoglycan-associated lipoprotein Pal [Gemmatimonadaceae bacterium]
MMRARRIAVLLVVAGAGAACHHAPPAPAPVTPTVTPRGPDADSARRAQEEAARRAAADAARRRAADSAAAAAASARDAGAAADAARAALTAMVHFDFDQSDLRPEDKATLDAKVPILAANPSVMIRVSGHTDERGSDEYNMGLGDRRARSAEEFLETMGIPMNQLTVISYGKDRPRCTEETEQCWQENRRAHITAAP